MRASVAVLIVSALAGSAAGQAEAPVRYDGHRVVRVTVASAREMLLVRALADDVMSCEIGSLEGKAAAVGTFDVRMSLANYARLAASGVRHAVIVHDLQRQIDRIADDDRAVRAQLALDGQPDAESWFTTYRSLAEITTQLQSYAAAYPGLATLSSIGNSVQNRPIQMIRITGPGPTASRPAVIVHANQHAREWVTPMSAMYIADRLLETYATDTRVRNAVDNVDFYIIPVVNPDGYEYSRTTNSQWRKNRRPAPTGSSCVGVDLNRNWGFKWGIDNVGSSGSPCSDTYRGPAAWSEPEIAGLKSLNDTLSAQGRLKAHWDVHANAQMLLSPWGYTTSPAPAALPLMNQLGEIIKQGMASVRGSVYPYGQGSVILYLNNGNTRDYSYGVNGAISWSIEMGGASFQPPVSEILPIAREAFRGLLPMAEFFIPAAPACYANCDGSTSAPALNALDFSCFLNRYRAGEAYANCDASTAAPTLNALDFGCFLQRYQQGCN